MISPRRCAAPPLRGIAAATAAGVAARPDGVGNHPNAWFKASRIYHKEVHEAKNPDAVKQVEPAAAAAAAPAVLLAN